MLLEEAGKPSYDLAYYLDENGDIMDASKALENGDKLTAVFAYTPEPTPMPEPTPTEDAGVGAPGTGSEQEQLETTGSAVGVAAVVVISVALSGLALARLISRKTE